MSDIADVQPEHGTHSMTRRERRWREGVQVVEVIILAVVALATAWSGYQSARWDGRQSELYGEATRLRFEADAASTLGGQQLVGDASMFNGWLAARSAHDPVLQSAYVKRFTPDYRTAFNAWLRTDPFRNPNAPAGPGYMPQYHNPSMAKADQLNKRASATFDAGTAARGTSEKYVRDTVLFATVLFLLAISQRFDWRPVRLSAAAVSAGLMIFVLVSLVQLPRF